VLATTDGCQRKGRCSCKQARTQAKCLTSVPPGRWVQRWHCNWSYSRILSALLLHLHVLATDIESAVLAVILTKQARCILHAVTSPHRETLTSSSNTFLNLYRCTIAMPAATAGAHMPDVHLDWPWLTSPAVQLSQRT
jgi:hypothetical protein